MAVKHGKLGALIDEIKNSAGGKTCIALDQDEKELNEANLMEYLDWQGEIGGMGQWTVDSCYTASLLAMGEPFISSTKKRKPT